MPIITISRGTFCGAQALAGHLARRLDVPCVSREIIVAAARDAGVPDEVLEEAVERSPSWFERFAPRRDRYVAFVRSSLLQRAQQGSFVYHGNNGHLLLSDLPNVISVRVIAPLSFRISSVMQQEGIGQREAERYIRRIDKQRARWTRSLYGVQGEDPSLYDLTVNLKLLTIEQASDLVCSVARMEQFQWTDALRQRVADLALASLVSAVLDSDASARMAELDVVADRGVVTIRGATRFKANRDAIIERASGVPGVREVKCEVSLPERYCRRCGSMTVDLAGSARGDRPRGCSS